MIIFDKSSTYEHTYRGLRCTSASVLLLCVGQYLQSFTVGIFSTEHWLGEKIAWRVTVWELYVVKERDIFCEQELLSTLQKYLSSVKRCLHFSAAIWWIHLEPVIHNVWYYELSFYIILQLCLTSACEQ